MVANKPECFPFSLAWCANVRASVIIIVHNNVHQSRATYPRVHFCSHDGCRTWKLVPSQAHLRHIIHDERVSLCPPHSHYPRRLVSYLALR